MNASPLSSPTPELDALAQIVALTCELGLPERSYVVVGEGNTSLRDGDDTFWIKASGSGMFQIDGRGFTQVRFAPVLELLENTDADAAAMKAAVAAAQVDPASRAPSVEVTFHAALLADCGVNCIGHTHPVAVNKLLCSTRARDFAERRVFPDQVVLCGPRSVFVPYTDPGLPLARAIRTEVRRYMDEEGEAPKTIMLENHGLIVLGQTPREVLNVTAMTVKSADIFAGACMVGDPVFMTDADIAHIYRRPDEIYRRRRFVEDP